MNRQARREKIIARRQAKKSKPKPEQKVEPVVEPEPVKAAGVTLLEAIQELDSKQPLVILKRRYLKRGEKNHGEDKDREAESI